MMDMQVRTAAFATTVTTEPATLVSLKEAVTTMGAMQETTMMQAMRETTMMQGETQLLVRMEEQRTRTVPSWPVL
jgi:hypothetical protein